MCASGNDLFFSCSMWRKTSSMSSVHICLRANRSWWQMKMNNRHNIYSSLTSQTRDEGHRTEISEERMFAFFSLPINLKQYFSSLIIELFSWTKRMCACYVLQASSSIRRTYRFVSISIYIHESISSTRILKAKEKHDMRR